MRHTRGLKNEGENGLLASSNRLINPATTPESTGAGHGGTCRQEARSSPNHGNKRDPGTSKEELFGLGVAN
jgi:hypothetical protein